MAQEALSHVLHSVLLPSWGGAAKGETGIRGAGKASPSLSAFLQGLAGERGVTGPAVSGGLCRRAVPRVVGFGAGPGHRVGGGEGGTLSQPGLGSAPQPPLTWSDSTLPRVGAAFL